MPSRYLMQIMDRKTNTAVQWEPGRTVECDFVEECARQIASHDEALTDQIVRTAIRRGIGFWRTEAHVEDDLRIAIAQTLTASTLRTAVNGTSPTWRNLSRLPRTPISPPSASASASA